MLLRLCFNNSFIYACGLIRPFSEDQEYLYQPVIWPKNTQKQTNRHLRLTWREFLLLTTKSSWTVSNLSGRWRDVSAFESGLRKTAASSCCAERMRRCWCWCWCGSARGRRTARALDVLVFRRVSGRTAARKATSSGAPPRSGALHKGSGWRLLWSGWKEGAWNPENMRPASAKWCSSETGTNKVVAKRRGSPDPCLGASAVIFPSNFRCVGT